jgi:hypothetical protein
MTEAEALIETRLQWIAMYEGEATSSSDKVSVYPKCKKWEYHCARWDSNDPRSRCDDPFSFAPHYSFSMGRGTPSDSLKIVRLTERKLAETRIGTAGTVTRTIRRRTLPSGGESKRRATSGSRSDKPRKTP